MDDFARLPGKERRAYIEEAAARRDLTATVIEKDLWVCWTLRRLVGAAELAGHMTFKGGTSLSKAYGIIHRFSEDIDLTISRSAPMIEKVPSPMEEGISGKERRRRGTGLKLAAQSYVAKLALPALAKEMESGLGTSEGWSLEPDREDRDRQTLLFAYPRTSGPGESAEGYIKPRIKLEFGARGETEPTEERLIIPYLAEDFPEQFANPATAVPTLAVERTYWEKVTILHALHHNSKLREGMSRHYYDVLMLDEAGVTEVALARLDLLESVVANKSIMFADGSASYGTAVSGSLRVTATEAIVEQLQNDYESMGDMFMAPPPPFAELIEKLATIETRLNAPK